MDIYIATKFEVQEPFFKLKALLEKDGHRITKDWTEEKAPPDDYAKLAKFAAEDYAGVVEAQALVLIPTEAKMAGAFVEFGLALGTGIDIIIVDPINPLFQANIFYHLPFPWIHRVKTIEDAAKAVNLIQWANTQAAAAQAGLNKKEPSPAYEASLTTATD